jgi:hypothetical protein
MPMGTVHQRWISKHSHAASDAGMNTSSLGTISDAVTDWGMLGGGPRPIVLLEVGANLAYVMLCVNWTPRDHITHQRHVRYGRAPTKPASCVHLCGC